LSASFRPSDPQYEKRVRESFARQGAMVHLGATMASVEPGRCEVELPFRPELSQQHGYFHAGVVSAIVDSAGGYAALTLFDEGSEVLTVEFKINLIAPADGERLIAEGRVVRSGRTLTVCTGEVRSIRGDTHKTCAIMQQTLMRIAISD
jgi:uncharacterized protein (TIGR00369 family)